MGRVADESGQLTFNISSLEVNAKETRLQIDLRIPVTIDRDQLIADLTAKIAPYELKYEHFDYLAPSLCRRKRQLVQTLMAVYQEKTGIKRHRKFLAERHLPGQCITVAFEAMLPGVPDYMHQANEQWPLESMYQTMDIYAEAIKRLCFTEH